MLDGERAECESEAGWVTLVQRLWARGLRLEAGRTVLVREGGDGLEAAIGVVYGTRVVDQRCLFHQRKNVTDSLTRELTDVQKQELQQEAQRIDRAADASSARQRLAAFRVTWQALQPQAVATLARDFEATIAYYQLEGVLQGFARTTSRELRRKFRQVGVFGSVRGVQAAVYLQVARLHCWWAKQSWWSGSQQIAFDLLNLHP